VAELLKTIEPAVARAKKNHPRLAGPALVEEAIKANVWKAVEDLFKVSPVVVERVKEGKLKVVGALYHLDTGKVSWMGTHSHQEDLIAAYGGKKQPSH
jgi:carbonic anhydrase